MGRILFGIGEDLPIGDRGESLGLDSSRSQLKIAVEGIEREPLRIGLFIATQLPFAFCNRVASTLSSMVLTIEQPDVGHVGSERLVRPGLVPPKSPNFTGDPIADDSGGTLIGRTFGLLMEVELPPEAPDSTLILRVSLQSLVSNTVALDLSASESRTTAPAEETTAAEESAPAVEATSAAEKKLPPRAQPPTTRVAVARTDSPREESRREIKDRRKRVKKRRGRRKRAARSARRRRGPGRRR